MIEKIKSAAREHFEEIQRIRHHLHRNPELSFQEFETADFVEKKLKEIGISRIQRMVKTGIVALIQGKNPEKKIIALRADLDALPIQEKNNTPYCSEKNGVMHACGHDVHTSCLLGAAMILQQLRNDFEGTIKLIFQPGEEMLPGGASRMIEEGILQENTPQLIIAQHVFPSMETGKVGFREGMYMASTDEIHLTIKGKGGHAAMPSEYINPLLIASEILLELNEFFMKRKHQNEKGEIIPCVLAFGKCVADGATNVIPETLHLQGTFRTMDETWREKSHQHITEVVHRICEKASAKAGLNIVKGYPYLVNNPQLTSICRNAAQQYLGQENVEELPLRMTAEDFAWFSQVLPSCFFRLGTGNTNKGITSGVHSPTFDVDEHSLEIGSGLMAWLSIHLLSEGN